MTLVRLENCINELQLWFKKNKLMMNDSKTEYIPFVPKRYDNLVANSTVRVGTDTISAAVSVSNLGVTLDRNLKMSQQVSRIVTSCSYKLRLINVIRNKLTPTVTERVVNAMITGNLDYCNSLLHGIAANQLARIQKIQNTAARLILKRDRRSSATAMLTELHWLPIRKRVMYKLLLLVYKSENGMAPVYIASLLAEYKPPRPLRSGNDMLLVIPKTNLHYGEISFAVAASTLWNSAPKLLKGTTSVDVFKKYLKTYLFKMN